GARRQRQEAARLREKAWLRLPRDLGRHRRRCEGAGPEAGVDGAGTRGGRGGSHMNIGVCGGTFDPLHRGHLEPVPAMRDRMQWERVVFVPAWQQPFKSGRDTASGYHRFAMAVLATRNDDALDVSTIELERGGVSYTVETLQELHEIYGGVTFDWIIG